MTQHDRSSQLSIGTSVCVSSSHSRPFLVVLGPPSSFWLRDLRSLVLLARWCLFLSLAFANLSESRCLSGALYSRRFRCVRWTELLVMLAPGVEFLICSWEFGRRGAQLVCPPTSGRWPCVHLSTHPSQCRSCFSCSLGRVLLLVFLGAAYASGRVTSVVPCEVTCASGS